MATWTIDPLHSSIKFQAKHMVITTVTGSFLDFSGKAETKGDDFENADLNFEAKINSVDTGVEQRDDHLRSADFFDAENYPTLSFKSTSFEKNGSDNTYKLKGDLTIKGQTNPVELDVNYEGQAKDMYGQQKAGFEARGKINRHNYGLTWSGTTDEGTALVSDDIKLALDLQLGKQE